MPKKLRERALQVCSFLWLHLTKHIDLFKYVEMKNQYAHALPSAWTGISKIFIALGDERRQRILMLFQRGEKLNAGQIAAACPLAQSTVSHHLKILREAGVLKSEKIGKEVFFWIETPRLKEAMTRVLQYLKQEM